MLKQIRTRHRHNAAMRAACHLIARADRDPSTGQLKVEPADLAALIFGRSRLRIDEADALEYLNSALVATGNRRIDADTNA
ncbi:hypothetical protein [Streptomyces sp. NPDC005780]|uniref:hypothetical protein n=1 Tax=Streptomyces sp. NPDC005780 TaxID=3364730 RepID=UPI00368B7EEB